MDQDCQELWLSAGLCGYPAPRNRKVQRSFKQKIAKVLKENVLRRSGIQRDVDICRSYGANPPIFFTGHDTGGQWHEIGTELESEISVNSRVRPEFPFLRDVS